jgi:predicted RND superfamily exporter protein
VIAVCTEFTSLILLRFVEERGRKRSPEEAMHITASRTGRAFIVSGLTAVAGVAVIATSPWPLLRGFGIIVGLNVLMALLCALVVLPPILIWAESGDRNWVSRHLVRDEIADDDLGTQPRAVPSLEDAHRATGGTAPA